MSGKLRMEWNAPNVLTLVRFLLIPVFCALMARDRMGWALGVFVAASLTDLLDGYLARKHGQVTAFGKLMDPLADKLMVLSLMIGLLVKGIIPAAAFCILIAKECTMVAGSILLFLRRDKVVFSRPIGKIAQFVTVVALVLCFFHRSFEGMAFPPHLVLLWTGVALSVVSMAYYVCLNGRAMFAGKK